MSSAVLAQRPVLAFIERLQKTATKPERVPQQLRCYSANTPGRHAVEAYIAGAFREQYDAHIDHFLPLLLTIEADGKIEAALGLRFAESEPLFVEHYLDQPVLAELAQRGIAHAAVVEIGNLVSTRAGCSQLLFILLAELLYELGRDTGIFTATEQVQQLLGKLGCELTTLCSAETCEDAGALQRRGLAECLGITRHQLFVDEHIPYTSGNSAMCFSAFGHADNLDAIILFGQEFLENQAASGSDPGLCVAVNDSRLNKNALIAFGRTAKQKIVTKQSASDLARQVGVHLSEHGGTGGGIIGALARCARSPLRNHKVPDRPGNVASIAAH